MDGFLRISTTRRLPRRNGIKYPVLLPVILSDAIPTERNRQNEAIPARMAPASNTRIGKTKPTSFRLERMIDLPRRLYMDNAATSRPKPPAVTEAIVRYMDELGA